MKGNLQESKETSGRERYQAGKYAQWKQGRRPASEDNVLLGTVMGGGVRKGQREDTETIIL